MTKLTLEERLAKWTNKTDGCWEWTGAKIPNGYGVIGVNGRNVGAHRVSYEIYNGPIPPGLVVRHTCDNRICVKPDHLLIGTQKDNVHDAMERGRSARGIRSGAYTHPESRAYGDKNGARKHPERMPHGERHHKARVTEDQVRQIRQLYASGYSLKQLMGLFPLSRSSIYEAARHKSWAHVK